MAALKPKEVTVVVGFMTAGGEMHMTPHHAMKRAYISSDKLIILRRVTEPEPVDRMSVPAAPGGRSDPKKWPPFGS